MDYEPRTLLPRAIVSLTGPETITLLERLVTNRTDDWAAGEERYGALLTPQGKVIADYQALRTADGVDLNVDQGIAEAFAKRLKMFRLRADVAIDVSENAAALFETDAARIKAGRPLQGVDFDTAQVFPAEINMDQLGGVALNKGCFVGQEVVSRMHRRGNIRKRTVALQVEGAAHGDTVMADAPLGEITSTADGLALARLRIDRLAAAEVAGTLIHVNEKPVTFEKPDWLQGEIAAFKGND